MTRAVDFFGVLANRLARGAFDRPAWIVRCRDCDALVCSVEGDSRD